MDTQPDTISHLKPGVRMARLRLIAGIGSRRRRMIVYSMKTIQNKLPIHSGRIRVRIMGEKGELPDDLRAIVKATDQDDCIEGSVLVDLCRQRSGQRGSGCDAPEASLELPTPLISSPTPPMPPAAQVRQYSWHHYALKDVYEKRREFVGRNKQTNRISLSFPNRFLSLLGLICFMWTGRSGEASDQEVSNSQFLFRNIFLRAAREILRH